MPTQLRDAIAGWIAYRADLGAAENTLDAYERDLGRLVMDRDIPRQVDRITLGDLERHVDRLKDRRLSPRSIARAVSTIRTWMEWLRTEGELRESPALDLSRPKVSHITGKGRVLVTDEMIRAIRGKEFRDLRDRAFLAFLKASLLSVRKALRVPRLAIYRNAEEVRLATSDPVRDESVPLLGRARTIMRAYLAERDRQLGARVQPALWITVRRGPHFGRPLQLRQAHRILQRGRERAAERRNF